MSLQLMRRSPRIKAEIGGKMSVAIISTNMEKKVQDKNIPRQMMINTICVPIQGINKDLVDKIIPSTIRKELRKCVVATVKIE